ncbi:hypothetical protein [Agarilytica rhodophyticola]|uniref:hypothetical protein n=1 Tax=Agarilytica rhodophyticola TaxID=1737490 RepID=UPI000B346156|nr:hypothetical protein [Agarilytica rhodophyticola]
MFPGPSDYRSTIHGVNTHPTSSTVNRSTGYARSTSATPRLTQAQAIQSLTIKDLRKEAAKRRTNLANAVSKPNNREAIREATRQLNRINKVMKLKAEASARARGAL